MKEYIERAAVLKYSKAMLNLAEQRIQNGKTESDVWKAIHQTQEEERREFVSLLENAPAAEVVEVRHAYWIDHHSGGSFCSACKRWVPYSHHPKYCETCGARMDKEDEHEADWCRRTDGKSIT